MARATRLIDELYQSSEGSCAPPAAVISSGRNGTEKEGKASRMMQTVCIVSSQGLVRM